MNILKWLDQHFEEYICSLFLAIMTGCIVFQIIFRFLGAPLSWTEELARYLFVWLIYISCSFAIRQKAHIKVDVLTLLVKKRGQLILDIISDVMFFLFAIIIAYYGFETVNKLMFVRPQTSAGLKLPMWIPYTSVAFGSALMSVRLIQSIVSEIRDYGRKSTEAEVN